MNGYNGTQAMNPAMMGMAYSPGTYGSQNPGLGSNAGLMMPQQQPQQPAIVYHSQSQGPQVQQYGSGGGYTTPQQPQYNSQPAGSPKSFYSPAPNPQWGQAQMMVQPTAYQPPVQTQLGNSGIYYTQQNTMNAVMNNFTTQPLPVYGNGFMNNAPKRPSKPDRCCVCCNDGYGGQGQFTHGLFQCCQEWKLCCSVLFCPCCLISRSLRDLKGSSTILSCLFFVCFCVPCRFRTAAREKYGVKGSKCDDYCVMISPCACCALTQAEREHRDHQVFTNGGPRTQSMA